jgi:hypothetical protein
MKKSRSGSAAAAECALNQLSLICWQDANANRRQSGRDPVVIPPPERCGVDRTG